MAKRGRSKPPLVSARPTKRTADAARNHSSENDFKDIRKQLAQSEAQLAATTGVLRLISQVDFNLQTVLDTLTRSAAEICEAEMAGLALPTANGFRWTTTHGFPTAFQEYAKTLNIPQDRTSAVGRALIEGKVAHIHDVLNDSEYSFLEAQRIGGFRTVLTVPLFNKKNPIGVFFLSRKYPQPFTEKQVEAATNYADQAVIAIENSRLIDELRQRTDELCESLEQQTATGEVLKVISRSTFDLKTVLDTLVESATKLCEADRAYMLQRDGESYGFAASFGNDAETLARLRTFYIQREVREERGSITGRAVLEGRTVHVPDVLQDREYTWGKAQEIGGYRAAVAVPLLREGTVTGVIFVGKNLPGAFTPKQIELVTIFADQAVIAIENTRLLNELTQSLQQQTATADVLKVISRSTVDLELVLGTVVRSAAQLCGADMVSVTRPKGNSPIHYHAAAFGFPPEWVEYMDTYPLAPDRGTVIGRTLLEARAIHLEDILTDPEYVATKAQQLSGMRAVMGIPLIREGVTAGVFLIARRTPQPFSNKQIELAKTFSDQALIAIENTRLFEELQARTEDLSESLLQQTATADVLKVISRSVSDAQPVLDTIVETAARLCNAEFSILFKLNGNKYELAAANNVEDTLVRYAAANPIALSRGSLIGRTALEGTIVHMPDCLSDPEYVLREYQEIGKYRSTLGVPLLRDGVTIGVIALMRTTVNPFTEREIELVSTLADQAVIAIENARLFSEVQARTEDLAESLQQQTATADVLKVISRSAFDLQTVLQTLVESAVKLCEGDQGTIAHSKSEEVFYRTASFGFSHEFTEYLRDFPVTPEPGSAAGRALLERRTIHVPDIEADPKYTFNDAKKLGGFRTILAVPMLRDGKALGVLALTRSEVQPFSEKQIELAFTFADQAAIAIENVRLFENVRARTRELSKSLEDLRTAQDRLVQTEKLASLGQLTAGIAHEIKNPLNFINNFSAVSVELIDELNEALSGANLETKLRIEINEIASMLQGNLGKVVQHGKRADSIVKNMLLHSRQGSGEHRPVDINSLVEESLNLAYHGARAEKQDFNIALEKSLDPGAGQVDLFPQEITRVLLNLISNGFYAATKRKAEANGGNFEPVLSAATRNLGDSVEIRIRDNGIGIPPEVQEKMFVPFFTTKPAGEGTGLGLSLSHDIIVKQHSGSIEVDTKPGAFTEFRIVLPREAAAKSGGRA